MQIVTEIPDEAYDVLMGKQDFANIDLFSTLIQAVQLGTPLPKGHGRIVDIDKVLEEMKATRTYDIPFALERVKPIIEADKAESKD